MAELLKALIMPSNLAVMMVCSAVILLTLRRFQRAAVFLLVSAGSLFFVFSTGTVACWLLSPLEYHYPYVQDPAQYPQARTIVVLTGYAAEYPLVPLNSRVNSNSAYRLLEAQRLYNACPDCDVIISGNDTATVIMKELLASMGVPETNIRLNNNAPHTDASARNLRAALHDQTFFLVTSAGHMRRTMGVFQKQGMQPIPAPTDFLMPKESSRAPLAPSPLYLYFSELAIAEYAGLAWYRLTGRI